MTHHKNTDQDGFSAVELIAVIAVVGIIGLLSFYVFNNNESDTETDEVATRQVDENNDDTTNGTESNNQTQDNQSETRLDNRYENSDVSFSYPAEWSEQNSNQAEWAYFESADYEEPEEGLGPSVAAGYLLEVQVTASGENESYQQEIENSRATEGNIGGSFEQIVIDDNPAILSTLKTHGTYITAKTFYNDKTYLFRLNAVDENDPETRELFSQILQTVQLR